MKNIKLILSALLIMTGLSAHAQEQVVEAKSTIKTTELALAANPKLVIGASEVSFTDRKNTTTFSASERIVLRIKTKEAPAPTTYTFTDGEVYTATAAATYGKVTYTRTFSNTSWQALYVPFSMDYDEWSTDFEIARIYNFIEYDDNDDGVFDRTYLVIQKKKSGSTEPNYPYLIRAKSTGDKTLVLNNKTLAPAESNSIDCSSVDYLYTFTGSYTKVTNMYANGYYALSGGALKVASNESVVLGAQRWYMSETSRAGSSSTRAQVIQILVDGEDDVEGICEFGNSEISKFENVGFDLTGRMVSTKANNRGVNIVNGKKIIR